MKKNLGFKCTVHLLDRTEWISENETVGYVFEVVRFALQDSVQIASTNSPSTWEFPETSKSFQDFSSNHSARSERWVTILSQNAVFMKLSWDFRGVSRLELFHCTPSWWRRWTKTHSKHTKDSRRRHLLEEIELNRTWYPNNETERQPFCWPIPYDYWTRAL